MVGHSLTFIAYVAIPIFIYRVVRAFGETGEAVIHASRTITAGFIATCGVGHLLEIIDIWKPVYRFSGAWHIYTGCVSMYAALVLWRLSKRAPQLSVEWSRKLYNEANRMLQEDFDERKAGRDHGEDEA